MRSILLNVLAILVCGGLGGTAAWWVTSALGIGGTVGALVALPIGMVVAVAAWVLGVVALDKLA